MNIFKFYIIFFFLISKAYADKIYYVSSSEGSDLWNGRISQYKGGEYGPVKSLAKVQSLVRSFRKKNPRYNGNIKVLITPGNYVLEKAWSFDSSDDGVNGSVTIYARNGSGVVNITGAYKLEIDNFKPITSECSKCQDATNIIKYQLPDRFFNLLGEFKETDFAYGDMSISDFPSQLYLNGNRLTMARWPNSGQYLYVSRINNQTDFNFISNNEFLPEGLNDESDLWASGFWRWDWQDVIKKVSKFDGKNLKVSFSRPIKTYGISEKSRFYLFNSLSFLDSDGEWFFDRKNNLIYLFYSKMRDKNLNITLPIVKNVLTGNGFKNIHFVGLDFSNARVDVINFQNVSNVVFKDCHIYAGGGSGFSIRDAVNTSINGGEVNDVGLDGIFMSGGDRNALKSSGNIIENVRVHNYAQYIESFKFGINVFGVGFIVRNNSISDAPASAVRMGGNENLLEGNHITRVLKNTNDAGAVYMARDWTQRGNVIRDNIFSNIRSSVKNASFIWAIYLDDGFSGTIIENNQFCNVARGILINGGSDNVVNNNVFRMLDYSAIGIYSLKGDSRAADNDPASLKRTEWSRIINNARPIWRKKYPQIYSLPEDGFGVPRRNKLVENKFFSDVKLPHDIRISDEQIKYQFISKTEVAKRNDGCQFYYE